MPDFEIDARLRSDCWPMTSDATYSYLLHKNAAVNWFVLVPHTSEIELYRLPDAQQRDICARITTVSSFVQQHFRAHKINVATLGNVVSQLHIHVIGRYRDDAYWPDPVWGKPAMDSYNQEKVQSIRQAFISFMHQA